ncbi:histidine phosphatase family protein [Streptomyces sp. ISL-86]|uniref:histidine phosphatase family protein n=1 Tax=Streptomyces sp. ISL-86 TaxID=2819187 RepID=UPI001BE65DF2|nr:histidine phosphatase family protein [Streptomyces sp. ISL-86]MBT2453657.1 histidine phosphatase family protein [Streptomyces sp. ISL-86]
MNPDTTYLIRHAQTSYSARHLVNGSLRVDVPLDAEGLAASRAFRPGWLAGIASCRTSGFTRTHQTAEALLAGRVVPVDADRRLNEIDYGAFEGGPWLAYGDWLRSAGRGAVPPGGSESWRDSVGRMLDGLLDCLAQPGPRLVVGHGLLGSVARCLADPQASADGHALPEAPYLEPLALTDDQLVRLVADGRRLLGPARAEAVAR